MGISTVQQSASASRIEERTPVTGRSAEVVAGFAAANIMLLSVSVWSGHASDMPASLQTAFHWLSALIALPAVAYAGKPFFVSARRALAAGRRARPTASRSLIYFCNTIG